MVVVLDACGHHFHGLLDLYADKKAYKDTAYSILVMGEVHASPILCHLEIGGFLFTDWA